MAGEFQWEPIFEQLRQQEQDRQNALKTEAMQVENEQAKMQQAMVAKAIEAMQGGFSQGGQRRDVGGFSRGASTMQDTTLGPGGPQLYDEAKTQYTPSGTGGTPQQQELARKAMGLTGRDPQEALQEKVMLKRFEDALTTKRGKELSEHREGLRRDTEGATAIQRKGEMEYRAKLDRETRRMFTSGQQELLSAALENRWTPAHQAAQELLHPTDAKKLASVEAKLKNNMEYTMTLDPVAKQRMRDEALASVNKEWDMIRRGGSGSEEDEEDEEVSEEEALKMLTDKGIEPGKAKKALAEAFKKKKGK